MYVTDENSHRTVSMRVRSHNLDGFVVEGRAYLAKSSRGYQAYLRVSKMQSVKAAMR